MKGRAKYNYYKYCKHKQDNVCNTVMHHLITGIYSDKYIVKGFCHCANIIEYTYTNIDGMACYIPRLYGITQLLLGCKTVQHGTILNNIGNCNRVVTICISNHRKGTVKICYEIQKMVHPYRAISMNGV